MLGCRKDILHGMSEGDSGIQTDNPRGPLDGVCRPHEGFNPLRRLVPFSRNQTGLQRLGVVFQLHTEQVHHERIDRKIC